MALSAMACEECRRRSALICALATTIRHPKALDFPNERLLHIARVKDPRGFLRGLEIPPPSSESVPTALCQHDPDYPETLAQVDYPPAVLYATCTIERLRELLAAPTVAIVGGHLHSHYAHQITFTLAHDLAAAGVTIISGLHKGINAIAHHGALHAEGNTIAVMPCAAERPYPLLHEHLHQCISQRGAAISELPPGFYPPQRWSYTVHYRIIAALADVVVVVEASEQSILLSTAQITAELGHEVAVVPGRVTDSREMGSFVLLRDGAHPVSCAQDVLDLIHQ
jgi:DNA processing protein